MSDTTILVIDDQVETLELISEALTGPERKILTFSDPLEALRVVEDESVDIILTDLRMPEKSGIEVLSEVKSRSPETDVIVLTGHGKLEEAVEAMKKGACDFFTKPLQLVEFTKVLEKLIELHSMRRRLRDLSGGDVAPVGSGEAMQQVLSMARVVAETDSTVLLLGETGSGKEVVANYIQRHSSRSGPYVRVNCAALPESLLESELFGHEKGAFTGASERRLGRFERAHKGTLFLDEIGELPASVQVKLLRVLQDQEIERIGAHATIKVDFRLICATHRDLEALVEKGSFREDLLYRINVFPIRIPSLRERMEDIPALSYHFLSRARNKIGRGPHEIHGETLLLLQGHAWNGNVRELENAIERACVLCTGPILTPNLVQLGLGLSALRNGMEKAMESRRSTGIACRDAGGERASLSGSSGGAADGAAPPTPAGEGDGVAGGPPWRMDGNNPLEEAEKATLRQMLQHCDWNYRRAAETLKMSRSTLYAKASRYGIKRER